jgi:hypothetical protein
MMTIAERVPSPSREPPLWAPLVPRSPLRPASGRGSIICDMADVFISFVHEDVNVAEAVQSVLQHELKLGNRVFMISDQYQVHAGEDWLARIRAEIHTSKIVLLMMSKRSVKRPWVNFEAGAGWILGRYPIPVCYGKQLAGSLPKPYSNFTGVDLPADKQRLLTSVAHHLDLPMMVGSRLAALVGSDKPAGILDTFEKLAAMGRPDLVKVLAEFNDEE